MAIKAEENSLQAQRHREDPEKHEGGLMRWGCECLDGDEEGESCRERKRKREWEVRVRVWDVWLAARYTSPYGPFFTCDV